MYHHKVSNLLGLGKTFVFLTIVFFLLYWHYNPVWVLASSMVS
jgi:hypothetical protein